MWGYVGGFALLAVRTVSCVICEDMLVLCGFCSSEESIGDLYHVFENNKAVSRLDGWFCNPVVIVKQICFLPFSIFILISCRYSPARQYVLGAELSIRLIYRVCDQNPITETKRAFHRMLGLNHNVTT